jgi:hypothetical protein
MEVARPSPENPSTILSPKTEALDELPISGVILSLEVIDQAPSLANDPQQTAPRMVVLLVVLEVFGEFGQPSREQRDLNFGGSGIRVVLFESVNGTSFGFGRDQLLFLLLFRASTRFSIASGAGVFAHRSAKKSSPRRSRDIALPASPDPLPESSALLGQRSCPTSRPVTSAPGKTVGPCHARNQVLA